VTPGSIVYDIACHAQLKEQTVVVYLDVPIIVLEKRFNNDSEKAKGVIGSEVGFKALFKERLPIYTNLSDVTIKCESKSPSDIALEIINQLSLHLAE
jgi:shikimate kinase